jgi:hypothetical protein
VTFDSEEGATHAPKAVSNNRARVAVGGEGTGPAVVRQDCFLFRGLEVVVVVVVVDVGLDFVGTADSQAGGVAALDRHEARVAVLVERRAMHLVIWDGAPDAPGGGRVREGVCVLVGNAHFDLMGMMSKSSVLIEVDPTVCLELRTLSVIFRARLCPFISPSRLCLCRFRFRLSAALPDADTDVDGRRKTSCCHRLRP